MTLTIRPELEEKIAAYARARGVSFENYATEILEREVLPQPVSVPKRQPTAEDLMTGLLKLAETSSPVTKEYPENFFSREVIYADHD